jgi:glyoxylate carboligase
LVHACIEGPEAGVYYRGKGTITNNHSVKVDLPDYVKHFAYNYTVQITPIVTSPDSINQYGTSEVSDGSFTVFGKSGSFYWTIFAQRGEIEAEPDRTDVNIQGDGPYKYVLNK